ncbi:MAG: hypothetical protein KF846_12595 [Cyclobacteriaceae bacterium]|nr:hypothetical protein [Cyclobacteriaceae bacterium]
MKKLLLLPALLLPFTLSAKIWIVDSDPGSASKDFTNLQEAHDGASAGDTLYLIGSSVSYITTKVTINKRLIIIGPGYFFNNPETQVSVAVAFLRLTPNSCDVGVEFAAGSEGSVMMGTTHLGSMVISTNNIMIKRNNFATNSGVSCGPHNRITISGSSVQLVQNFIEANQNALPIRVNSGFNNIRIYNNFFIGFGFGNALTSIGSSGEVVNNISWGAISAENTLLQNNIILATGSNSFINCVVRNNVSIGNNLPTGNGNIQGAAQANLFVGTGTLDGGFKLKDGSPAIGTGFEGVDMGMFGGDEPYVLSGIPPIPTIYQLNAPAVGEKNTGLPITVKAKANN